MQDLFGREVKRGDIIAFSDNNRANQVKYVSARLGVVNNVLPKRTYKKGESKWNKVQKRFTSVSIPDEIESQAVISFYQIFEGDDYFLNPVANGFLARKNGKPKRMVSLATAFIIVNKEDLDDKWKAVYDGACKAFKI